MLWRLGPDRLIIATTGVYTVLAMEQIRQVKDQAQLHHFPGQVEATHYLDSPVYATFNALEVRRVVNPAATTVVVDPLLSAYDMPELLLLDSDGDDLPGKLENYTKKMTQTFVDDEPSEFMNPTLRFALKLSEQKKVTNRPDPVVA